jgi:hypothetical protein
MPDENVELRIKVQEALDNHEYKIVEINLRYEPNIEAVKKILREYDIDAIFLEKGTLVDIRTVEVFVKLNNMELGKKAKEVLYKAWGIDYDDKTTNN